MTHFLLTLLSCLIALMPIGNHQLFADEIKEPKKVFSTAELETLVTSIALYPDTLLQQLLAASTFPDQLIDAATFNQIGKDPQLISQQPWDPSVQSMANYPSILEKMVQDLNWTLNLASAFINQNIEIRAVIQKLRAKAKALGNLKSTDNTKIETQQSTYGQTIITIESVNPDVIYVPADTTVVVYQQPVNTTNYWAPVASFGVGMALGYAIGDSHDDHYYYGGYYGPGFWNRNDSVNDWIDYRQDRWDDAYDFANDRQNWKQDNRDDWREYQQDLGRNRQDWQNKKQQYAGKVTPEQRAQAQTRTNDAKSKWNASGSNKSSLSSASMDLQQANQRLAQARSNPQVQQKMQQNTGQFKSTKSIDNSSRNFSRSYDRSDLSQAQKSAQINRSNALSGLSSSGSAVSRAQSRGAVSRGSVGGGLSGARSGGFSAGGRRR